MVRQTLPILLISAALAAGGWLTLRSRAAAADPPKAAPTPQEPEMMDVLADVIEFDPVAGAWIFTGDVEAVSSQRRLTADKMVVKRSQQNEVNSIHATGHVSVEEKGQTGGAGSSQGSQQVTMTGTSDSGDYDEQSQKMALIGNVVLHYTSASLAEPALITGARADMDMKADQAVIVRSPQHQVKAVLKPKGKPPVEGQPATPPEAVELHADRMTRDGKTDTVIATGDPVMIRAKQRVTGDRISFIMDREKNDLKEARVEGHAVFDGDDEKQGHMHMTSDRAVLNQATDEFSFIGNVKGSQKTPDNQVRTLDGCERLDYNVKTGAMRGKARDGSRVTFRLPIPAKSPTKDMPGTQGQPGSGGVKPPDGKR
jgi:lipopolysaccharide transport protein LptA